MTSAKQAGAQLRAWRETAGLTQDQVAAAARERGLRWTRATVAAIEIDRRELSFSEFLALRGEPMTAGELSTFFNRAAGLRTFHGDTAEQLDAEMKAARKLKVEPRVVVATSRRLWGRTLTEERDGRVDDRMRRDEQILLRDTGYDADRMKSLDQVRRLQERFPGGPVQRMVQTAFLSSLENQMAITRQAFRGHVTRALVAELKKALKRRKG